MLAKILYVSDMHKRWKDSESVKGILEIQNIQQQELIDYVKLNHITHVFLGGDWYDRGFHGLGYAFGQHEMDRRLSRAVNGEVYLCVGNHFYLERDENPEMYTIQPNELIKTELNIPLPETPIFKCVKQLIIGTVQIDFFHYSKTNKEYYTAVQPGITYHIGLYHDDLVCPAYVREMEGYHSNVGQDYYNKVFSNVDIALCGHIHSKVGLTQMTLLNGRNVPLYIPGSMHATRNVDIEKHSIVSLPVICIDDDSTITYHQADFNTHLDELRFYAGKKTKKREHEHVDAVVSNYINRAHTPQTARSLGSYLQANGYTQGRLRFVESAMRGDLSFSNAVNLLTALQEGDQV